MYRCNVLQPLKLPLGLLTRCLSLQLLCQYLTRARLYTRLSVARKPDYLNCCAVVAAFTRCKAKTPRSFSSAVTLFALCARTRLMASPDTELVVSIPEVQLHKVPIDCAVVSTRQNQSSVSAKYATCRSKVVRRACWNGRPSALS